MVHCLLALHFLHGKYLISDLKIITLEATHSDEANQHKHGSFHVKSPNFLKIGRGHVRDFLHFDIYWCPICFKAIPQKFRKILNGLPFMAYFLHICPFS